MASAYRPRAPLRLAGVSLALAVATGAALVVGGVYHLIGRGLELYGVGAVATGFAVGAVVAWGVRRARLARPALAAVVAALAAALVLVLDLGLDLRQARAERAQRAEDTHLLRLGLGGASAEELVGTRRAASSEPSLRRFLARRLGLGDDVAPLGDGAASTLGAGAALLALLELGLAAGIAASMAARQARHPACERCGQWRVESRFASAAYGDGERILASLCRGDLAGAVSRLRPPDTREELRFALLACPAAHDEGGAGVLRVYERRLDRQRRLRSRALVDLRVSAAERAAIAAALDVGEETA